MNLEFGDPIKPFKEAFTQLLAPKELKEPTSIWKTIKPSSKTT